MRGKDQDTPMTTLIDDILQKDRCRARIRFLGFLWRVECGGRIEIRPSRTRPNCAYAVCERCGDVTWPPQKIQSPVYVTDCNAKGLSSELKTAIAAAAVETLCAPHGTTEAVRKAILNPRH
jgi:hypothetical protein